MPTHNDMIPEVRFNRTQSRSPSRPSPRPRGFASPTSTPRPVTSGAATPEGGGIRPAPGDRDAVVDDAERFLRQAKGDPSQPVGSADWLKRAGLNIRRASDAQHLEAIALAYATHVRIQASPLQPAIVAELEGLSGRKRSRTTTDLHLVVERFVSYGGETPAERLAARKLVSRDVRAIRHLEAARVLPSRVRALAATPGQGLHAWARRASLTRRVNSAPTNARMVAKQARTEARQRALIHDVVITTQRPDGSRKARRRFRITGVLASDLAGLRARLRMFEKQASQSL